MLHVRLMHNSRNVTYVLIYLAQVLITCRGYPNSDDRTKGEGPDIAGFRFLCACVCVCVCVEGVLVWETSCKYCLMTVFCIKFHF